MQKTSNEIVKFSFVRFPRHSQRRMRVQCLHPLVKKVKTSGNQIVRPLKFFCYSSCLDYLSWQPGNRDLLNHWRYCNILAGVMVVIYNRTSDHFKIMMETFF